jgi:hypothetical protein
MRIQDEAPLTLICQTHGPAVIVGADGETWLGPGDLALARGVEHYMYADDPKTPPQVVIHPVNGARRCTVMICASSWRWASEPGATPLQGRCVR